MAHRQSEEQDIHPGFEVGGPLQKLADDMLLFILRKRGVIFRGADQRQSVVAATLSTPERWPR
jgi:hypothetical protein